MEITNYLLYYLNLGHNKVCSFLPWEGRKKASILSTIVYSSLSDNVLSLVNN